MPSLDVRNDTFGFKLPKTFIPDAISNKYTQYINRMPTLFGDAIKVINSNIQSVTFPAMSYDPVEQYPIDSNRSKGHQRKYRAGEHIQMLQDREFTVSMRNIDGCLNYWIMFEVFFYHYSMENSNPFTTDMNFLFSDTEGIVQFIGTAQEVLFTGISDLTISYSEIISDFTTFDCTFSYNNFGMHFPDDI